MNERQRDMFMYLWSKRRARGLRTVALRGLGIGALGGVLFGWLLSAGPAPGVHAYDTLGQMTSGLGVYLMSIPVFALIGWRGATRVFSSQEAIYQSLLASGARVPDQKPELKVSDRGPAVTVGITVAVLIGFILFVWVKLG